MPIELNRDDYDNETLQAGVPVLVDFWGPQCRPCLALMPGVEELEKEYDGRLKVAKVNASQNRMLCVKLRVISLPTFILYKDGAENNRLTGEHLTINDLKLAVESLMI